jgi:hypothetical protein
MIGAMGRLHRNHICSALLYSYIVLYMNIDIEMKLRKRDLHKINQYRVVLGTQSVASAAPGECTGPSFLAQVVETQR